MNARSWNAFAPCVPAFLDFAFALRFRSYLNIFFCSRVPSFASRSCIAFLNRTLLAFLKFKPVKHAVPVVYGLHKTRSVNLLWENNLFPKENHKVRKRLGQIIFVYSYRHFLALNPPASNSLLVLWPPALIKFAKQFTVFEFNFSSYFSLLLSEGKHVDCCIPGQNMNSS